MLHTNISVYEGLFLVVPVGLRRTEIIFVGMLPEKFYQGVMPPRPHIPKENYLENIPKTEGKVL